MQGKADPVPPFNWGKDGTGALLDALEPRWDKYNSNTYKTGPIFDAIRDKVKEKKGLEPTDQQIKSKISSLKDTFERRDKKSKDSGAAALDPWHFHTRMQALMGI